MKKQLVMMTTLVTLAASTVYAHLPQSKSVLNFPITNEEQTVQLKISTNTETNEEYLFALMYLKSHDFDIFGVDYKNKTIDVGSKINQIPLLKIAKLKYRITSYPQDALSSNDVDSRYFTSDKIETFLKQVNTEYPHLTRLIEVGKTTRGKTIWGIKISGSPEANDPARPTVLFNSMHHAREVMSPEITTDMIRLLTSKYTTDAEVKSWLDTTDIYVVPMINVDGNDIVWREDSMWRKNAGANGKGVDINRNYPYKWSACNGSSNNTNAQDYHGPSAASEPETKAMMNLVSNIRPIFDISYHAYSELVIYPFGCKGQRTPNQEVVQGIGWELGKLIKYQPGTSWELLYSVDGGDIDWMYNEYSVLPYVLEVNSSSDGFHPNYSKRDQTVERNRVAWMHLLRRLTKESIIGKFELQSSNGMVNETMVVEKQNGNSFQFFQNYRLRHEGHFYLILKPGTYKLKYGSNEKIVELKEGKQVKL